MATVQIPLDSNATVVPPARLSLTSDADVGNRFTVSLDSDADITPGILIASDAEVVAIPEPENGVFPSPMKGCDKCSPCLTTTPPYDNISTEAIDQDYNIGQNWGNPLDPPPLGSHWYAWWCYGECDSTISQADADACAAAHSLECDIQGPPPTTNPTTGLPYALYGNKEITESAKCPDGGLFYYTVPQGLIVAVSQQLADKIASTLAKKRAKENMICIGNLPKTLCLDKDVDIVLNVFSSHRPLTIRETDPNFLPPMAPVFFSSNLPPGVIMQQNSDHTVHIFGHTLTAGDYTFAILAKDPNNNHTIKVFTLGVRGITNPLGNIKTCSTVNYSLLVSMGNTPYVFSLASGSLPTGLTMGPAGTIMGTPTVAGTYHYTVQVKDADGLICTRDMNTKVSVDTCGLCLPVLNCPSAVQYMQAVYASTGFDPVFSHICGSAFTLVSPGLWCSPTGDPSTFACIGIYGGSYGVQMQWGGGSYTAWYPKSDALPGCPIGSYHVATNVVNSVDIPQDVSG